MLDAFFVNLLRGPALRHTRLWQSPFYTSITMKRLLDTKLTHVPECWRTCQHVFVFSEEQTPKYH